MSLVGATNTREISLLWRCVTALAFGGAAVAIFNLLFFITAVAAFAALYLSGDRTGIAWLLSWRAI